MSREVRSRLEQLRSDADFNAFCIDEFPDIHRRFSATADRQQRINDLFQLAGAEEVERKLNSWLARPLPPPPLLQAPSNVAWFAFGLAALALVALSTVLVVVSLRPQVVVVPVEQFDRQIAAQGLTRDRLDSPAQFATKVERAGPRNLRYEVSVDRDRKTQELMRLVLALRIQNDQLVAATTYLLGEVQKWQHGTTSEAQLLAQLTKGFEVELEKQQVADMSPPGLLDLARVQPDIRHPEPADLAAASIPHSNHVMLNRDERAIRRSIENEAVVNSSTSRKHNKTIIDNAETKNCPAVCSDAVVPYGYLHAYSSVPAEIIIDDMHTLMSTPYCCYKIYKGKHKITLASWKFNMRKDFNVVIAPGGIQIINNLLSSDEIYDHILNQPGNNGYLDININPGSKIIVDGADTGMETPQLSFRIMAGEHLIELINPQSNIRAWGSVTVARGETRNIDKVLKQH